MVIKQHGGASGDDGEKRSKGGGQSRGEGGGREREKNAKPCRVLRNDGRTRTRSGELNEPHQLSGHSLTFNNVSVFLREGFLAAARGFALVVPPHRANQLKSSRPRGLGAPERRRCCLCCTARPALTYLYVTALAPKLLTATLSKSPHLSC